jgi:hypothetical protein
MLRTRSRSEANRGRPVSKVRTPRTCLQTRGSEIPSRATHPTDVPADSLIVTMGTGFCGEKDFQGPKFWWRAEGGALGESFATRLWAGCLKIGWARAQDMPREAPTDCRCCAALDGESRELQPLATVRHGRPGPCSPGPARSAPRCHPHHPAPGTSTWTPHCRARGLNRPGSSTRCFSRVLIRQRWHASFKSISLIAPIRS